MNARLLFLLLLLVPAVAVAGPGAKKKKKAKEPADSAVPAVPDGRAEAKATFDKMVETSNAFQAETWDLYSPTSVLKTRRVLSDGTEKEQTFAVAMVRQMVPQLMAAAKLIDDRARYENIVLTADGEKWRVSADRYSTVKCRMDKEFYAVIGKGEHGSWLIEEEFGVTSGESLCPANPEEARRVLGALRDSLLPMLPLEVDSDTRLDSVAVDDLVMTYSYTLPTTPSSDPQNAEITEVVEKVVMKQACGMPSLKHALHHGGSARFIYQTSDSKPFLDKVYAKADCE